MQKGSLRERDASLFYHRGNPPLALSSLVLRELGCGQCDIAYFKNRYTIVLVEVKGTKPPGARQLKRLRKTARLVESLFNFNVELRIHQTSNCQSALSSLSY